MTMHIIISRYDKRGVERVRKRAQLGTMSEYGHDSVQ